MKKSNIKFLQIFIILIITILGISYLGISYFFNYKEGSDGCPKVVDDDRCNKRKECTWRTRKCVKSGIIASLRRPGCIQYDIPESKCVYK